MTTNPEALKNYGSGDYFDSDVERLIRQYRRIIEKLEQAIYQQVKLSEKIHSSITEPVNGLGKYEGGKGDMAKLLQKKRQEAWTIRNDIQKEFDSRIQDLQRKKSTAEKHLEILLQASQKEKAENKKIHLSEIQF